MGGTLGLCLGVMGVAAAWVMLSLGRANPPAGLELLAKSAGVGISITAAVVFANLAGGMIPLLFKRIGLDPAVTSGPFLTLVMDISGVLIYFTIATGLLAWMGMV